MALSSKGQDTGLSTPKCWVRDPQVSPFVVTVVQHLTQDTTSTYGYFIFPPTALLTFSIKYVIVKYILYSGVT